MEIIEEKIHHEFNDVKTSKNNAISISNSNLNESNNINTAKSSSSFLNELFLLLISLFPDNKDEKKYERQLKAVWLRLDIFQDKLVGYKFHNKNLNPTYQYLLRKVGLKWPFSKW